MLPPASECLKLRGRPLHWQHTNRTLLLLLLPAQGLEDVFTPVEQLTLLLSAAVHDVGHQGAH